MSSRQIFECQAIFQECLSTGWARYSIIVNYSYSCKCVIFFPCHILLILNLPALSVPWKIEPGNFLINGFHCYPVILFFFLLRTSQVSPSEKRQRYQGTKANLSRGNMSCHIFKWKFVVFFSSQKMMKSVKRRPKRRTTFIMEKCVN